MSRSTVQQDPTALAIMDALIDGLRLNDKQLHEKAILALTLVGPNVLPFLEDKAESKGTKPDYSERLLQVAQWIETYGKRPGNEGQAVVNYLIDALRVSNKKLNEKAADALCSLPPEVVDELVPTAFANYKKATYCVRLSGVIERIGQIPKAEDQMKLMVLAKCGNSRIHEAVRRVLISAHPQKWDILEARERLGF